MRLLMRAVAQGLYDAGGDRIRVEVAAGPVEEVPLGKGRVGLHEVHEVGALPHCTGPLVGRWDAEAMLSALLLHPFHHRERFRLPGPSRPSKQRGVAVSKEVRKEAPDKILHALPVTSLPLVDRRVLE